MTPPEAEPYDPVTVFMSLKRSAAQLDLTVRVGRVPDAVNLGFTAYRQARTIRSMMLMGL
jgi:hypothetical protein